MIRAIIFLLSTILSVDGVRRLPDEIKTSHGRRLMFDANHAAPLPQSPRFTAETRNLDPDSHLVTSLPLLPDGVFPTRHWAGHLPAAGDGSDKKIFYWLFEPGGVKVKGEISDDMPLILWMNGGPGCSSMDGLWLENGPLRLKSGENGWTIDVNPHSWHNAPAWTLYVDQPVGTGLSFSKKGNYCKNDFEINRDFQYFLEEFFLFHKEKFLSPTKHNKQIAGWTMKRPFYFTGESHAGHYIPSMMDFILRRNDGNIDPTDSNGLEPLRVIIPLSGAAIGNGWIDPFHQYAAADAAYGAGLIGTAQRASFEDKERECQSKLKSGNYRSSVCFGLLDDIIDQSGGASGTSKVSQYDNRLWEKRGQARSFPLGHKDVETYLGGARSQTNPPLKVNYRDVLAAIHAGESIKAGQTYRECTDPPYLALQQQDGLGVVDELVRVLDHESKPHMLIFNGINDMICNHVGNEKLLDLLPWSKTSKYTQQPRHAWNAADVSDSERSNFTPGRPDGYIKQFENLSFLKVLESGHMVPMDQPAVSLSMMRTLVYGTGGDKNGFLSSMQNLVRANVDEDARMCKLDQCPDCLPDGSEEKPIFSTDAMASSLTLSNLGILLAAFASGIIITCLCQRRQRAASAKSVLVSLEEDMEMTDQDSIYRDNHEDGEYT